MTYNGTNPFRREGRTNFRSYEEWQDIGFTALTDWVNVYRANERDDDSYVTHGYWTVDCPGVLLQESTEVEWHWDEAGSVGTICSASVEHERITRTAFATPYGEGDPALMAVDAVSTSYERSMSLRDFRQWMQELDAAQQNAADLES